MVQQGGQVRTSGLAIASMVLGIFGIVFGWISFGLSGFIGLPFGIAALVQIHKSRGTVVGEGMAIAGIITSSLPAVGFIVIFVLPWLFGFQLPEIHIGSFNEADVPMLQEFLESVN